MSVYFEIAVFKCGKVTSFRNMEHFVAENSG